MKVYIISDIEGCSSLATWDEAKMLNPEYAPFKIEMSKETRAAILGCEKAGANEIIIEDGHGNGRNIIADILPKNSQLIRGYTNTIFGVNSIFDDSYDAILFVGYHSKAGSKNNPTSHTISSSTIYNIDVNGESWGEFEIDAYAAAYNGVKSIYISGDYGVCKDAKSKCKNIFTTFTKKGEGNSVITKMPDLVCEEIEKISEQALLNIDKIDLLKMPKKFTVKITYIYHYDAQRSSNYPNAKRIDDRTILFESNDYGEILRFFYFVI